jgi:hypothetical protein
MRRGENGLQWVGPSEAGWSAREEENRVMGDKGEKSKSKSQKQKQVKQDKAAKQKRDKQPKRST